MIIIAIALFSLAALLGIFLFSFVLKGKETPKAVTFTHGPLAAIGLLLLIIYVIQYSPAPLTSLALFAIAAVGGLVMIARDLTGKSLPKWLALLHGLLAAAGLILLLKFAFL